MAEDQSFDRAKFVNGVAQHENEAARNAMYQLLDFAEEKAYEIRSGSAKLGSFHYAIAVGNQVVNLFTCNASGSVSVSFWNFKDPRLRVPNRPLISLGARLRKIPGIGENVRKYPDRPGFEVDQTIVDPKIMSRFQSAILGFQRDVSEL